MARKSSGISQQPFLNHDIKTQGQQARFLGSTPERTKNLGHDSTVDRLTENPVGYPLDYQSPSAARVINETRSQGVYGKFRDPQSGIAQQNNLDRWADYAKSNSYTGHGNKAGLGKPPTVRDPRGSTVPSVARNKDSDGYLESTKNWPSFEYGSESGLGRIEKARK
jgi:hypothetical protein